MLISKQIDEYILTPIDFNSLGDVKPDVIIDLAHNSDKKWLREVSTKLQMYLTLKPNPFGDEKRFVTKEGMVTLIRGFVEDYMRGYGNAYYAKRIINHEKFAGTFVT